MGKVTGFMEIGRETPERRPVEERVKDWREVYKQFPKDKVKQQGARCMDCGVPFCHNGCPLGNLIPDWNDLAYRGKWDAAIKRLHYTNNFPEFTGRLCPAPCESACVLAINEPAVSIKQIELSIIDEAFWNGRVLPEPPKIRTGKNVAIIGSGPAGLAAAAQLNKVGHLCTVYERDDRIGGLMRYGIPEFKMEKRFLNRRLEIMEAEGIRFVPNANIGIDIKVQDLRQEYDALVLCCGALQGRDLPVPGRDLEGIHLAMTYLPLQNRRCEGDEIPEVEFITAQDKRVIILGGGDTGADCLGTAIRQGCRSVHTFEIMPQPPRDRAPDNPWPQWARIERDSSADEEGGERDYNVRTTRLWGKDGRVTALDAVRVEWTNVDGKFSQKDVPGSEFTVDCDLVLLALGFVGPEKAGPIEELGLKITRRGNVWTDEHKMTSVPGVFSSGDMARGQSLIVWAIAEGRHAARGVDLYLMGKSDLPSLPWTC